MTDVVLIQNGKAHEIFHNVSLAQMTGRFHADLVAQMVEVPSETVNENDIWDGENFSAPTP